MNLTNEVNILSRREIEPLIAKTRQVLLHYNEALGCNTAVLDRNGIIIQTPEYKRMMKFCDFCKKHCHNPAATRGIIEHSCKEAHAEALAGSRNAEETRIYSCPAGFFFWTGPLHRNGRYVGAVTAGQVLTDGRENAVEKFRAFCKNRFAAEKIQKMLSEIPEKNHEEIQAMARLLGVCAGEISEKCVDSSEMIRRVSRQEERPMEPAKKAAKMSLPSCPAAADGQGSPLEKEQLLLAAFRRGDIDTGGKILREIMENTHSAIPQNFEAVRFRAIELVVLLSRAAIHEGSSHDVLFTENDRHLKRIQESGTVEELIENLLLVSERMAGKIFSFQGIQHASVLRRAERYIWDNYTRRISLDEIAKASGLSAPYFSTIFKEEMGENFSMYLNRIRVERAATLLTETGKSLKEIAFLCGFEDQSWFSKIFKCHAGTSPGKFREQGCLTLLPAGKKPMKKNMGFPESAARPETRPEARPETWSLDMQSAI